METNKIAVDHKDLDDIFSSLDGFSDFDLKKEEVGSGLAALLAYKKCSRSELADRLSWSRSRVTRVLSGSENATLKTIWQVAEALGCDFDVVFREACTVAGLQMWCHSTVVASASDGPSLVYRMQDVSEVHEDIKSGSAAPVYFSVVSSPQSETVATLSHDVGNGWWRWGASKGEVIDVECNFYSSSSDQV